MDEVIYTTDAWNDYDNFQTGMIDILSYCDWYMRSNNYDSMIHINHSPRGSKIIDCFEALGVPWAQCDKFVHTEAYLTDEDHEWAKKKRSDLLIHFKYPTFGFIHSKTGVPNKDFPTGYSRKWMGKYHGNIPWHKVDMIYPITRGFALMDLADVVVVADSVYYHAAGAMDKDVDLAYFARGKPVYDRVKPLHDVKQNIVYELEVV